MNLTVLHAINALCTGGAEILTAELCVALSQKCKVTLFTYAGVLDRTGQRLDAALRRAGVNVIHGNIRRRAQKFGIPVTLGRVIDRVRPDVLHVHLDQSEVFAALAVRLAGHRPAMIRTLHNTRVFRASARALAPLLRATYDWDVACGPAVADALRRVMSKGRFTVIRNGINTAAIAAIAHQSPRAARESLRFVSVGSMALRDGRLPKAQDVLIKAWRIANVPPGSRLQLAGDGPERQALHQLAVAERLDSVDFLGVVQDIPALLAQSDVVVLPSRVEGLSLAAAEAACAGRPLITSTIPEFADFRQTALTCAAEDVGALASALTSAGREYQRLRSAAMEAAPRYQQEFDITRTAAEYLGLYQHIFKRRHLQGALGVVPCQKST
jgi:glycosyltransferase involved in cell wall biosynthesis